MPVLHSDSTKGFDPWKVKVGDTVYLMDFEPWQMTLVEWAKVMVELTADYGGNSLLILDAGANSITASVERREE